MAAPYLGPFLVGLLGALARRAYDVRNNERLRFFDLTLPLDILIFIPGVFVGMAVNEQLALSGNSAAAVMVLTGYVGWRSVLVFFSKLKGIDVDWKGKP